MSAAASIDRFLLDNTRSVKVHGVEAELEQRWQAGQRLRLVYGWQKGARLFRGWHAEQLAPPFAQSAVV